MAVFCLVGGQGLLGGEVLGEEVVQVQSMGKVVCAGGIWRPALTTLFLWPTFKGEFRGGAGESRYRGVSGWSAVLCWPPNMFRVSVAFICTICLGTSVEQAAIWVAELGGH